MKYDNLFFTANGGVYDIDKIRSFILENHISTEDNDSAGIIKIHTVKVDSDDKGGYIQLKPDEIKINFEGDNKKWPQLLHIAQFILEKFPSKIKNDQSREISLNEWEKIEKEILAI